MNRFIALHAKIRLAIAFLVAILVVWAVAPVRVQAAMLPTLPALMDTAFSLPTGNTITVNAGGNLQNALNSAVRGDKIILQAGATFTGPFTLPNKTTGTGWIYIMSSDLSKLPPPGNRVSPLYAANMPKIVVGPNAGGAIQTAAQAHHFRFVGIEIKPSPGAFVFSLVTLGSNDTSNTTVPDNIVFDRCYIHADPSIGGRRGITFVGTNIAAIDSHLSGFKEAGSDTQAIFGYQGNGPFKIVNNYLEAASENVIFGGADPTIPNSVPSDIEIRGNHFFKPLVWLGAGLNVKNLLEFKNAQRVLVEGNVFENNFLDGQNGFSLLITPRNQSNTAPWCVTQDITIRLNKFINLGQGINMGGRDNPNISQVTNRVLIENNVMNITQLGGADGRIFGMGTGPINVTIRHNTAFTTGQATAFVENVPKADQFDFRDNLMSAGSRGFAGTGTGEGLSTLNAYYTNFTFTKNAIIGSQNTSSYPTGNFFPANIAAVGFVNYAAGNYALSASSPYKNAGSDGKDLGADIAALSAVGAGTATGSIPAPANARVQ